VTGSRFNPERHRGARRVLPAVALALAAVSASALAGCTSGAMGADVNVELGPSALHLSRAVYDRQGAISFNVDNQSGQYRDLLVVRFNHMTALPLTASGTVDVSRLSLADQIDVLAPGRYHFLSPDLTPGTYMFVSMAVPQVRSGPPIVGNQRYAAQVVSVGPYQPAMAARFVVS
jgi:hypothetical protein